MLHFASLAVGACGVSALLVCGCFNPSLESVRCGEGAQCPPQFLCDLAANRCVERIPDANTDAGRVSGDAANPTTCASKKDAATVAFYSFESTLSDSVGGYDAVAVNLEPEFEETGVSGCGRALRVEASDGGYVNLGSESAWRLATGSVDFFVNIDDSAGLDPRGLLSRDASGGDSNGHIDIMVASDRSIVARFQTAELDATRCSEPNTAIGFVHVGVNFGDGKDFELWVDGNEAQREGGEPVSEDVFGACGVGMLIGGIDGNENPWVLGASTLGSVDGSAEPVERGVNATFDNLRISSSRRDFSEF